MVPHSKFFVSLLVTVLFLAPAFAQDAALIEAAKKEGGRAVVYGSLESRPIEMIEKAFQRKTGLRVDYWRASATKIMDRAMSEYRAGKPLFDVITTITDPIRLMSKDGIFARYDSPSAKAFAKETVDLELGPRYRNVIIGVVYNKGVIKPENAPKSLEDIVKPQYKGKLVMPDPTQHTTTTQWLANLHKIMGKERADKFIRDLAAMKPILVESLLPSAERVMTGETPIAITYVKYAYIFGREGANLDYLRDPRMLGDGSYITLSRKAPHPNAGKALIDFFLGPESMDILAKDGEFVNRKGIYPPLPDADKIGFLQMEDLGRKGYAEKKKEYSKIFLK